MICPGGSSRSGASTSCAAGSSRVSGRCSICGDGTITAMSPWRLTWKNSLARSASEAIRGVLPVARRWGGRVVHTRVVAPRGRIKKLPDPVVVHFVLRSPRGGRTPCARPSRPPEATDARIVPARVFELPAGPRRVRRGRPDVHPEPGRQRQGADRGGHGRPVPAVPRPVRRPGAREAGKGTGRVVGRGHPPRVAQDPPPRPRGGRLEGPDQP